jgi:hemin uptake protein HemP
MALSNESSHERGADHDTAKTPSTSDARTDVVYASDELFRGVREITITHAGASYRLRITHANKLILTK